MIALGTAQFGMKYGINNLNGIPGKNQINKILKISSKNNISYIDTAMDYGNSQLMLGNNDLKNFKIISKIHGFQNFSDLQSKFELCLKQLGVRTLYGLMAHSVNEIVKNDSKWNDLLKLKENKKNLKIGISLYNSNELDFLISNHFIPDIIQIPFNLFDIEFLKYLDFFKKNNIQIFSRSVFLQGIIFMQENKIPLKLSIFKPKLLKLKNICEKHEISIVEAALGFVSKFNFIEGIIVGVETPKQLKLNLDALNITLSEECFKELKSFTNTPPFFLNKVNRWKNRLTS